MPEDGGEDADFADREAPGEGGAQMDGGDPGDGGPVDDSTVGEAGTDATVDVTDPTSRAVAEPQITSVAPTFLLKRDVYNYAPRHTLGGDVEWEVVEGPEGMRIEDGSRVEWDTANLDEAVQDTPYHVRLRGRSGDTMVEQEFDLAVATLTQRASRDMRPDQAYQLSVTAPTSSVRGAGVNVRAGALSEARTIAVNEIDKAPAFPNQRRIPRVIDFGPSGTRFNSPATVALPFDTSSGVDPDRMGAYTFNTREGRWESVPVVRVDAENGILHARASHFSIYAASESAVDYTIAVESMDEVSICQGALAARGELESGLDSLDVASINNLSPEMRVLGATTLHELVAAPEFVGSIRVVRFFKLVSESGASARKVLVSTLNATTEGSTIVHTDSFGNVIASARYEDHRAEMEEVDAHLSGFATHAFFDAGFGGSTFQIGGRLHVIYSEQDQSLIGAGESALGSAAVEVPAGSLGTADPAVAGFDVDCDRYRGGYDAFDDSLEPRIVASPEEAVTVLVETGVVLTAEVIDANAPAMDIRWEVIAGDASATLTRVEGAPASRTFLATVPGFYTVRMGAIADGKELTTRFNILVMPRPVTNTPPTCVPTALLKVVDVGQTATIFAAVDDRQTATDALDIEWGLAFDTGAEMLFVPSASIQGDGTVVGFTSPSAGSFQIGCRAYDGEAWGEVRTTRVGVVEVDTNLAPVDFTLSPPSAQAVVGDSIIFRARATDPDGDPLTFEWIHPFPTGSVFDDGSTLAVDTMDVAPGTYTLLASVTDGTAPAQYLPASLRVLAAPIEVGAVDGDDDGFPADLDCDDSDSAINSDAAEICGNDVDENCDGVAVTSDCDGDDFDADDCDDFNPEVNPDAYEYCDGRDNDCDDAIDETHEVGSSCSSGVGECASTGEIVCSPDGISSACSAQPVASSSESCDGLDNDCDGQADEGGICLAERVGIWMQCDPEDSSCDSMKAEGFEITSDGRIIMMRNETDGGSFGPSVPLCIDDEGTITFEGDAFVVEMDEEGETMTVEGTMAFTGTDRIRLAYTDPDTSEAVDEPHRRVTDVDVSGACPDWCDLDNDQDGTLNCEDPCPDDSSDQCGGFPDGGDLDGGVADGGTGDWCLEDDDRDGTFNCEDVCPGDPTKTTDAGMCGCHMTEVDTDGDDVPDSCEPQSCDADGIDNNEDGTVDEIDEPCHPVYYCDADGLDNDYDGSVDEPGEPCEPDPCMMDSDSDGMVDCEDPCPFDDNPDCDPCAMDSDSDGMADCEDPCPFDDNPDCGPCMMDSDSDGTVDCEDPCPFDDNPNCDPCMVDSDSDGMTDCDDPCPHDPDTACSDPWCENDDDMDGVYNCEDPCPSDATDSCQQ